MVESGGEILLAAVLLEIAITLVVIPFVMIYGNPLSATPDHPVNLKPFLSAAALGCAVLGFAFGQWTARAAGSRFALHGFLTGLFATVLYVLIEPPRVVIPMYSLPVWVLLNVLRISGCSLGGIYAAKRAAIKGRALPLRGSAA